MRFASQIWTDIKMRFSRGDKFRIADLTEEIQVCKQGTLGVSDYYTKLMTLHEELELFRTVLLCSCSTPCSCGILDSIRKEREDHIVIRFLRGLNEQFSHILSHLMTLDPLPPITKVFSRILQQEFEFNSPLSTSTISETLAFAASKNSFSSPGESS